MNFIPKITYTEIGTGTPKTVDFSEPPEADPLGESYSHIARSLRSSAGVKQTQFNYNLKKYKVKFLFESLAVITQMIDFITNHASRGGDFNYFISNDEVEFEVFQYVDRSFRVDRPIPNGSNDFEYDFRFNMERVL